MEILELYFCKTESSRFYLDHLKSFMLIFRWREQERKKRENKGEKKRTLRLDGEKREEKKRKLGEKNIFPRLD